MRRSSPTFPVTDDAERSVYFNRPESNAELRSLCHAADNTVSTSKYTLLSFIPKNLFEFFRVVANCYFLIISVLQVATDLSPTNQYTTITPLTVVLLITMIKQGVEDWERHRADTEMNNRPANVLRGSSLETVAWREVVCGDIVVVDDRHELPADVVILATSEELGKCFTETSNLDGETNLKRREALKPISERLGVREVGAPVPDRARLLANAAKLRGRVRYELPNHSLYTFVGAVDLDDAEGLIPIGPQNVILRGCMLRSTKFMLGLVVFTGNDTKIMMNQRPTPSKQSNVYKVVNRCIFLIFITQFLLCLSSTIAFGVWSKSQEGPGLWYMGDLLRHVSTSDIILSFFTFLILFNNLVPISLYVSLDMIKVIQARMIEKDPEMRYTMEDGEEKYAKARTSDLNEDLGQIEYIFSDKTGTLTRNMMEFRKCSIGGIAYGFGTTEIGAAAAKRLASEGGPAAASSTPVEGVLPQAEQSRLSDPQKAQVNYDPALNFDDPRLLAHLREGAPNAGMIHEFLTLLAVCHTVIPETDDKTGAVAYRAASPDEEALVKAAKALGYDFKTPAPIVHVETTATRAAETAKYEILNVNEFNSARKRMSVVVRTPSGKLVLYCKGADNVMFERAAEDGNRAVLTEHLKAFASEGLRTLVLAMRELSEQEYESWKASYEEAAASLQDRAHRLEEVAEVIEQNMMIVGATAIEDKLQAGVPDAIASLAEAGIKIWVLTGDKEETAINIGYACRLLTNKMTLLMVNKSDPKEIQAQLQRLEQTHPLKDLIASGETSETTALIMDGKALLTMLNPQTPELAQSLLRIARCCKAVVACRVSPSQKASIVNLVRRNVKPQPLTLAIGDGANDVNMIQTAHVGVGISGQEGVQAVNSSDYAIAQFRFLKPLLLVHGRLNYRRIAKVILYSFYKNIALVITLYLFNFYNGYSGTTLFESFVMAGWNFFLALPIIVIGISDRDVSPEWSLQNPALYVLGQWNRDLNVARFVQWIVNAVLHAVIVFFLPLGAMLATWDPSNGRMDGLLVIGTTTYTCLLMTMNLKVALIAQRWTWQYHVFFWGSIAGYFVFLAIWTLAAVVVNPPFHLAAFVMFSRPTFWFLALLVPLVCIAFDVSFKTYMSMTNPIPNEVLRELELGKAPTGSLTAPERPRVSVAEKQSPGSSAVHPDAGDSVAVSTPPQQQAMPSSEALGASNKANNPHLGFDFSAPTSESYFAKRPSGSRVVPPSAGAGAGVSAGSATAITGSHTAAASHIPLHPKPARRVSNGRNLSLMSPTSVETEHP